MREPTFSIVKSSGSRFVLVADVSGSMKDFVLSTFPFKMFIKLSIFFYVYRIVFKDYTNRQGAGLSMTLLTAVN